MQDGNVNAIVNQPDVGAPPSFQVYQDVYNRLTGRSEKIKRLFYDKHHATLDHILNLNHVIEQAIEQYTCHSSSVTISVYYVDGTSERWSSFERFRMQAPTKSVCVESIEIEYDFLLTLPKLTDPRPYKIVVGLRSEVGFHQKLDLDHASDFERQMSVDIKMATARFAISYVDLVVARSFEAFVSTWYSALPRNKEGVAQVVIRFVSPFAGIITRVLLILTSSVLCYLILQNRVSDVQSLFVIGIASASVLMIVNILGFKFSEWVTRLLSNFKPFSFLHLSEADLVALSDQSRKTSKLAVIGGLSWLGIVLTGVVVNYVSKYILP